MMMIGLEHIWPLVNHNFSFIQFTPAHIPLCTLPTQDIYTSAVRAVSSPGSAYQHNPDSQTAASPWDDLRYSNTIVTL